MNIWLALAIITAPAIIYGTALQAYGYIQRRRAARHRTHAHAIIDRVRHEQADATEPHQDEPHGLPVGWHWPGRDHDPPPADEPYPVGPRPYLNQTDRNRWP